MEGGWRVRRFGGNMVWRGRVLPWRNPRSSLERLELEGTASTTRLFHRPGGRWDWDQPLVRDEGLSQAWGLSRTSWRPCYNQVRAGLAEETICVWRPIQWKMDAEKPFGGQRICYSEERWHFPLLRQDLALRTYFLCCTTNDKQKDRVAVTTTSPCLRPLTSRKPLAGATDWPHQGVSQQLSLHHFQELARAETGIQSMALVLAYVSGGKSAVYVLCRATIPGKMWWSNNFDARGWLCWDPRAFPQRFP